MVWVLVSVRSCVAVDTGHSLVTLFSLSVSVKDRSLHKPSRQVTDLLSRAHTCVWALGKLVALLSRIRLFPDRLLGFVFGGGGPCTALSPRLRDGGLESQFGRGLGHPGQESDGLVLLMPGVQAGCVFLGYPARGIDSRIAGLSGTTCLRFSIVVRTERCKMEDGKRKPDCLPPARK